MEKIILNGDKPQKKKKPGKLVMSDWARKELRRRKWSEWRAEFAHQVRFVFVVMLVASAIVFESDQKVKFEKVTFEMVHHAIDAVPTSKTFDRYRQTAKNYGKQLDDLSK